MPKLAIVVGASGALGGALASELVRSKVRVVGCHLTHNVSIEGVHPYKVDVRNYEEVQRDFDLIASAHGKADYLVLCQGVTVDAKIETMTLHEWRTVMDVNLNGCFCCIKAGIATMNSPGHILVISSVVGEGGCYGAANYSASKAGLVGLVKSAASELAGRDIRVNLLSLGYFDGGMGTRLPAKIRSTVEAKIPLGRFGTVKEFANTAKNILFSDYITGQIFTVDGGLSLGSGRQSKLSQLQ